MAAECFGREIPMSGSRRFESVASTAASPEDALIQAESGAIDRVIDRLHVAAPMVGPPRWLSNKLLRALQHFVPPEESFLLQAHFIHGQTQASLGDHLGTSQQAIQIRLQRTIERVRWIIGLETWEHTADEIRRNLAGCLTPAELRLVVVVWGCRWNQSRAAHLLKTDQSSVRKHLIRLLARMQISDAAPLAPYSRDLAKVFEARAWCFGLSRAQNRVPHGEPLVDEPMLTDERDETLALPEMRRDPVEAFIGQHLRWRKAGRVAHTAIAGRFEDVTRLPFVRLRGVLLQRARRITMRTAYGIKGGYAGVELLAIERGYIKRSA